MKFTFYILYSVYKDRYYVGHIQNLEKRVAEHRIRNNLGTNDWALVYNEVFATKGEAMVREIEIKSKNRRSYLEQLITIKV